jgi:hypothetical protein
MRVTNHFGVAAAALLCSFFPIAFVLEAIRDRRKWRQETKRQLERIMPANYGVIDHVHEIDFHRSGIVVTDAGAIFARCCLAGCEDGVFIGCNVAAAWKLLPPEPVPAEKKGEPWWV